MLPFEAQGCRFIFEVVFNHPMALKFLLCLESGLHRATGPVHTYGPWPMRCFKLFCMSQKSEF